MSPLRIFYVRVGLLVPIVVVINLFTCNTLGTMLFDCSHVVETPKGELLCIEIRLVLFGRMFGFNSV